MHAWASIAMLWRITVEAHFWMVGLKSPMAPLRGGWSVNGFQSIKSRLELEGTSLQLCICTL